MKYKKTIIVLISACIFIGLLVLIALHTKSQVKDVFRLNSELQREGYYMGDFEFKMMGVAYWLDKGYYFKALSALNKYHSQLESRKNLVKAPVSGSKEEELEFYLNLQNPKTGAFIDDYYPYPVYNEITENLVEHIASLSKELGRPVEIKYPLRYLDEINTLEELHAFLDDTAYVGWLASKFPQTSYVFTRSILSYANSRGVISENNLYYFSPEWKHALLEWFYDNQDPETGFWGPRSRSSHKLLKKDITNVASIIKAFVDSEGNNIYEEFPLRYKEKMFLTTLEVLSEPMPNDADLDEIHEWNLKMGKGIAMLTRYLLNDAALEDKEKAGKIIGDYVRIKFKENYIPSEGAFSYYPNENQATLDGVGNFFLFKDLGAFSWEKQERLWGESLVDLGTFKISEINGSSFDVIASREKVNSIRIYKSDVQKDYLENIALVFYPQSTSVLDILDLTPKIRHWVEESANSMGNWTSKETILQELEALETDEVPIYENEIPLERLNELLKGNRKIVAVFFDVLQVPRCKITFEFERK